MAQYIFIFVHHCWYVIDKSDECNLFADNPLCSLVGGIVSCTRCGGWRWYYFCCGHCGKSLGGLCQTSLQRFVLGTNLTVRKKIRPSLNDKQYSYESVTVCLHFYLIIYLVNYNVQMFEILTQLKIDATTIFMDTLTC